MTLPEKPTMTATRLAIVGAGRHSRHHGAAAREYSEANPGRVELAAVCDLDQDKARDYAQRYGFARVCGDLREMLRRERPDAVIAVTALADTEAIAGELLEAGVPVMIEKPPGRDSAATERLLAIAERTGTPHMISFNRRFNPAVAAARRWLAEHAAVRPPQIASGRMLRHNRREANFARDTGIHLVDAVLSFMGEPRTVAAARLALSTPQAYSFNAHLEFAGAAVGSVLIAPAAGADQETIELYGEDYYVYIDVARARCDVWDHNQQVLAAQPPAGASRYYLEGTVGETAAFVEAIETGRYWPTLRDGLVSMRTAEAVQNG